MFFKASLFNLLASVAILSQCASAAPRKPRSAESLLAAAMAAPAVAYKGIVEVSVSGKKKAEPKIVAVWSHQDGRSRREILDRLGIPLTTIVDDGHREWVYERGKSVVWKGERLDKDLKLVDPDEEMDLILANFDLRLGSQRRVAGLPCRAVEFRSLEEPGRLMAAFCIHPPTGLALEKESFSGDGSSVRTQFSSLELGEQPVEPFSFRVPAGSIVRDSRLKPDFMALDEAESASGMTARLPVWTPKGYVLESVNLLAHAGTTVLHYRYTDGIDAFSVFQAPEGTRLSFSREEPAENLASLRVGGRKAQLSFWSGGRTLTWENGARFVLVARLPLESMRRIAESVSGRASVSKSKGSGFSLARPLKDPQEAP